MQSMSDSQSMADSQWNVDEEMDENIDYEARINIQISVLNRIEVQNESSLPIELSHDLWAEFDKYTNLKFDNCIVAVKLDNEGKIAVYTLVALTRAMAELNGKSGEIDDATKIQQLLYFIQGCRLLLEGAKSKEEYDALTADEKAQYSSLEQKTRWFEHTSETAPIIKRAIQKINNTQLLTNITKMQTMLQDIKPNELQLDADDYIPIAKHVTPDCKITKFDYNENSPEFLTLEISNASGVVYRLQITTDYEKVVTIIEWHSGDANATERVYKLCETATGEGFHKLSGCYQMDMFYRQSMLESYDPKFPAISHDCTKFVGVPVVDMSVNYNTTSSEVNGRFVEKHDISHKFILGEVVNIDNQHGDFGNTLETIINFNGKLLR